METSPIKGDHVTTSDLTDLWRPIPSYCCNPIVKLVSDPEASVYDTVGEQINRYEWRASYDPSQTGYVDKPQGDEDSLKGTYSSLIDEIKSSEVFLAVPAVLCWLNCQCSDAMYFYFSHCFSCHPSRFSMHMS
uniref:Uncharacterized protein n=1 Tax=Amphimedon queenslandica TaxID=400682 RepID=A0A1X7SW12_AMPQE